MVRYINCGSCALQVAGLIKTVVYWGKGEPQGVEVSATQHSVAWHGTAQHGTSKLHIKPWTVASSAAFTAWAQGTPALSTEHEAAVACMQVCCHML